MMIWRDFFDGWDIAQSRPFDIFRMFYSIAVLLIRAQRIAMSSQASI